MGQLPPISIFPGAEFLMMVDGDGAATIYVSNVIFFVSCARRGCMQQELSFVYKLYHYVEYGAKKIRSGTQFLWQAAFEKEVQRQRRRRK